MNGENLQWITLMLGAGWAAGLNLYATLLTLGWLGASGQVELPPALEVLENPWVMGVAGLLFVVEFFADKVPWVDSLWDALQTFLRIPGGLLLGAGMAQGLDPGATSAVAGALLGGGLATGSHLAKTGTRALVNTSPEPVSNWSASLAEDLSVVGGLWTALHHPWLFLALLLLFLLAAAWLLPRAWRRLAAAGRTLGSRFRRSAPSTESDPTP